MYTQPGGKLLFMGTELAPWEEWSHERSLPWHLADGPMRAGLARYLADLGALYRSEPALWAADPDPEGFAWIDATDADASVFAFLRTDPASDRRGGGRHEPHPAAAARATASGCRAAAAGARS